MKHLKEDVHTVVQVERFLKALDIIRAGLSGYANVKIVINGLKTLHLWKREETTLYLH